MRREIGWTKVKKYFIAMFFTLLLLIIFVDEYDTEVVKANAVVMELSKDADARDEILGNNLHYGSLSEIGDRLWNLSYVKALLIPVLLILGVILLSFIVVEIIIKKKEPKE